MQRENAATAAAAFGQAGSVANQGYWQAGNQADLAYQDAVAQQQWQQQQAAQQAADNIRRGNIDAINRNATYVSSARGGNMGMALLNAQNNATASGVDANRRAGETQQQLMSEAGFQAAGAQRQAAAQQADRMSQLQGTAERAAIEAARALEAGDRHAAQIASEEQRWALEQLSALTTEIRQGDLGQQSSNVDYGQLGLQIDQMIQGGDIFNAKLALEAAGINAEQAYLNNVVNTETAIELARMNGDWQSQHNILMSEVYGELAQIGVEMETVALARLSELVLFNLNSGMSLEEAKQAAYETSRQTGANFDVGAVGNANTGRGDTMGLVGSAAKGIGAAAAGGAG
jgi:hypothetical protein